MDADSLHSLLDQHHGARWRLDSSPVSLATSNKCAPVWLLSGPPDPTLYAGKAPLAEDAVLDQVLAAPAIPDDGHARGIARLASLRCAGSRGLPARRALPGNHPGGG